ncbi:MAG: hypothetical protein AAFN18_11940 [Cyanobacteria bacterium J06554_6]
MKRFTHRVINGIDSETGEVEYREVRGYIGRPTKGSSKRPTEETIRLLLIAIACGIISISGLMRLPASLDDLSTRLAVAFMIQATVAWFLRGAAMWYLCKAVFED